MRRTAVINVVGLSTGLLGARLPRISSWADAGRVTRIDAAFPAVTCTAQANYLTGKHPEAHGIVGNGWYFRDECEIRFWRQSNHLVQAQKVWELAKAEDGSFTCANLFWWYNMYSTADISVTPRPMYPADGRKIPDIYTNPPGLRSELQSLLGRFPLFEFWGPRASIASSRWIADSAKYVEEKSRPTLSLVYLPHLDYALQRHGTGSPAIEPELNAIDAIGSELIGYFESRGVQVVLISEYGITNVSRPVHINRVLREKGLVAVREELGLEILDPGASAAFAVADHQVAHIYVNDRERMPEVRGIVERIPGVEAVLGKREQEQKQIGHTRSGDLVAVACEDAWFTYYYWSEDRRAPDFARTVDIHRKPGYDPVELFLDPAMKLPKLGIGWRLLKKRLGFRTLMDVIPLDAGLVKGSHGRAVAGGLDAPVFITQWRYMPEVESTGRRMFSSCCAAIWMSGRTQEGWRSRSPARGYFRNERLSRRQLNFINRLAVHRISNWSDSRG